VLTAWLLFPLVLAALALGCGLLLERAAGTTLPRPLLLPAGTATIIVASLFPPLFESTASLATPLVIALAASGYALAFPFRRTRVDGWAIGAGVVAYLAFAAPVLGIWRRTFAGYIKLDDTATYLAMLDRYLDHGYNVANLTSSTYERTLTTSLSTGYPMGSLMPLGIGHTLLGTDTAWLWQPYLSFLAAMLALGLYVLVRPLVQTHWLRAFASAVAAASALLYGYALWGGIKEMAQAMLLVLVAALVVAFLRAPRPRAALPLAVGGAATLGSQSAAGVIWLLVPAIVVVVVLLRRPDRRASLVAGAALVGATLALAIPTLSAASMWLGHTGAFTGDTEYGNLYRGGQPHRIEWPQILGIWPAGDFRNAPERGDVTGVLVAVVAIAAVLGIVLAWRRRAWGLLAYTAAALVGMLVFWHFGSPWIEGKAFAIVSPLALVLALAAAGWVFESGRRVEAVIGAAAILFGVAWSDSLAYHDVLLAPGTRLAELQAIGNRYAGQGPTLENDYDPYGARHFLRKLDAEGASELRVRPVYLRTGALPSTGESPDVDEIQLPDLLVYRTLVTRRSPAASRPPSVYQPVAAGKYYEVWQRPLTGSPRIVEHLSLGDRFHAAAVPRCSDVLRLARVAGPNGRLAVVDRPSNVAVNLDGTAPGTPGRFGETGGLVIPTSVQSFPLAVNVPTAGNYEIGVDGSFQSGLELYVNGKRVASARNQLNWPSEYNPLAVVPLRAGSNRVELRYTGPDLHPGSAGTGTGFGLGPVIVGSADPAQLQVRYVTPADARSLCGKSLDWIEAVQSS
jgi:hypothetical protein